MKDPISAWSKAHFSDLTTAGPSVLGYGMVTSDPKIIEHVLARNHKNYVKDKYQNRLVKPGLGTGLFTSEAEAWQSQRKALSPLFAKQQVKNYVSTFSDEASAYFSSLFQPGKSCELDVTEHIATLTLKCLNSAIFSALFPEEEAIFGSSVNRYLKYAGGMDIMDVLGAPTWMPRLSRRKGNRELAFARSSALNIIRNWQKGESTDNSVVSVLMKNRDIFSNEDILANIITMIAAGHETTANSIIWTIYLIASCETTRSKVCREVNQRCGLEIEPTWERDTPYLYASFLEAMRLYPPAAVIGVDWGWVQNDTLRFCENLHCCFA